MNVPSKLIETTIEEFKAEGYTCRVCSCQTDNRANGQAQVVTLAFEKAETTEEA